MNMNEYNEHEWAIQHLLSWQRGGLRSWPKRTYMQLTSSSVLSSQSERTTHDPNLNWQDKEYMTNPKSLSELSVRKNAAHASRSQLDQAPVNEENRRSATTHQPDLFSTCSTSVDAATPLTLEERIYQLEQLKCRVAECHRCPELVSSRTQTVFGVGSPTARIMFIGEAPGADEDRLGEPFVGRAGQLLNDIIKACRLKREEVYICNILRCRPPNNRYPRPDEAQNCREYLDGQIAIVNPEYIVCWGSCAAQNLLQTQERISALRQRWYRYKQAKVICTYHPSYLLRNPAAKRDVWEDMKFLFRDMGIDLSTAKNTPRTSS